jgi:hypothetical protein
MPVKSASESKSIQVCVCVCVICILYLRVTIIAGTFFRDFGLKRVLQVLC